MVRENHLKASDFIYPLFIHEKDFQEEISAMPGTFRWDMNGLIKEHRDYFDFCGPTFGPVPILGPFIRWLYSKFVS